MLRSWQEALDYLYSLTNWETRPPGVTPAFELERFGRLLVEVGEPQRAWPAVHVAGTNGKGSTSALVASALVRAGLRTGLYTSPHLHTVRERIRIDGEMASEAEILAWLDRYRELLDGTPGLTTFEALTAVAFGLFASKEVDVAVVEVGLGGRLDTTNVVEPVVSIVTPIGLDHTEVLGRTIAEIASDKAGILRPLVPAVVAPQDASAARVLEARAAQVGAPLVRVESCARLSQTAVEADLQRFRVTLDLAGASTRYDLRTSLLGPHQRVNVATATVALGVLRDLGWRIATADVERGIAETRWPGRLERLGTEPTLIVDGAHNPHAAEALRSALDECYPGARTRLILGASADKDVAGFVRVLLDGADSVVATRSDHPRAMEPTELCRIAASLDPGLDVRAVESVDEALDVALSQAAESDIVVATGSIFLVADVREAWAERRGDPMPPRDPPRPARE